MNLVLDITPQVYHNKLTAVRLAGPDSHLFESPEV